MLVLSKDLRLRDFGFILNEHMTIYFGWEITTFPRHFKAQSCCVILLSGEFTSDCWDLVEFCFNPLLFRSKLLKILKTQLPHWESGTSWAVLENERMIMWLEDKMNLFKAESTALGT